MSSQSSFYLLRRTAWLWLALLLAWLGALAPTLSHVLRAARGAVGPALTEICTSTGPRPMILDAASGAPEPTSVMDHCPFCLLTAERLAPPPQIVAPGWGAPPTHRFATTWAGPGHQVSLVLMPPPRGPPPLAI